MRSRLVIGVAWTLSLLAVGSWASAQSQQWTPVSEPAVIAGEDLGFRVEWMHGEVPVGTLVVRVKGTWMRAEIGEPPARRIVPNPSDPPQR
jgi:hypothetical protein